MLGDALYASGRVRARAPRLALHAFRLAFTHPRTGEAIEVTAPLADELLEDPQHPYSQRLVGAARG